MTQRLNLFDRCAIAAACALFGGLIGLCVHLLVVLNGHAVTALAAVYLFPLAAFALAGFLAEPAASVLVGIVMQGFAGVFAAGAGADDLRLGERPLHPPVAAAFAFVVVILTVMLALR